MDSFAIPTVSPPVSAMMIEKIIVVAPTTAVPMSTGLAVALKVLPAPSFSSSSLGDGEVSELRTSLMSPSIPGIASIVDNS